MLMDMHVNKQIRTCMHILKMSMHTNVCLHLFLHVDVCKCIFLSTLHAAYDILWRIFVRVLVIIDGRGSLCRYVFRRLTGTSQEGWATKMVKSIWHPLTLLQHQH